MCMGGGGAPEIKDTEAEKALAEIGIKELDRYFADYPEFEQQYFDYVDDLNSPGAHKEIKEDVSAAGGSTYATAIDNSITSMKEAGINPNSGKFKQAVSSMQTDAGIDTANTVSQSQQALQDSHLYGKNAITAMGNGQQAEAIQGFSTIAGNAHQQAVRDATNSFESSMTNKRNIASGIGAATAIYANEKG